MSVSFAPLFLCLMSTFGVSGLAVALMLSSAVSDLLPSLISALGVSSMLPALECRVAPLSDLPFIADAELPPCCIVVFRLYRSISLYRYARFAPYRIYRPR